MTFARLGRIILALPVAAMIPACVFSMFGSFPFGVLAFMYAIVLGFFFGVPLFIIFQFKRSITAFAAAIGGFIVAAIPIGFITWPINLVMKTTTVIDGTATVINGVPTFAGWLEFFTGLVLFGGLGILAGLAFFQVLKFLGDPLTPGLSNSSDERSQAQSNT